MPGNMQGVVGQSFDDNNKSVSGKKVVLWLAIGFVLLAAVFGFGTFGLANLMRPLMMKKGSDSEKQAIHRMEEREKGNSLVR